MPTQPRPDRSSYTRRDYERSINRTLGWIGGSVAFLLGGSFVTFRRGLSVRTAGVSLTGTAACLGMAVLEVLQDFENSRT